MIQDTAGLHKR